MIKIPGLVVRDRIARSTLLDVYRCTRNSDNRSLVLKVGRTDITWPAGAQERLLVGSELHARIKHPNVVPLFHYGLQEGVFYAVEGYISGPDLATELTSGISLPTLTAQLLGIAEGLAEVHANDAVHGDVKPEHIKIRGNGTAQLLDFGFASPTSTHHATWGSPGYLSPEQVAGQPVDARSDIFSLGVVLFKALTGYLPYGAQQNGTAIAYDRIPRLPDHFAALQVTVEKAIAHQPDKRFQSVVEFGEALNEAVNSLSTTAQLPQIRSEPISTRELRELNLTVLTAPLDSNRQEKRSQKQQRRRVIRRTALGLLLVGTIAGAAYYIEHNQLISMDSLLTQLGVVENPQLTSAWNEAQSLSGDSNQDLAAIVAAYRRVLAIDPQHVGARNRLDNLESEWKQSVTEALQQGNIEAVATRLEAAKNAFTDDVEWLNLRNQLTNRQRAERIITSTGLLLASHGLSDLPSATAAIQSYQEVLRLAPGHPVALKTLRDLSLHYAGLANTALSEGRLSDGISLLERATAADPSVPLLDEVRKRISQATMAREAIDDLLQRARRFRSEGQLMAPPGENAAELYHRVLATDPSNAIARQGLIEITSQVAANAEQLLARGRLAEVDVLVNQAQAAGLAEEGVAEIRRRADAERLRQSTITQNLTAARTLINQGYLTQPLDNNAVAKLREVQQIDPGNTEATEMLQQCAQRLAAVALEAYEFGFSAEAKQYLDLALAITPEVESWTALRDSWEVD